MLLSKIYETLSNENENFSHSHIHMSHISVCVKKSHFQVPFLFLSSLTNDK